MSRKRKPPSEPARPKRLKTRFERAAGRLSIAYRRRDPAGCFLVLWLIGWTVGCVFLVGLAIKEPKLMTVLFAVPFWASWIFVFCLVLKMFMQFEEFALDAQGASYARRTIVPMASRQVPLNEILGFGKYARVVDSESGQRTSGLKMHTLGAPLKFAEGLSGHERLWLEFQLNDHLAALGGGAADDERRESGRRDPPDEDAADPALAEAGAAGAVASAPRPRRAARRTPRRAVLALRREAVEPPSDSAWQREDSFDWFAFRQRGKLSWGVLGGLLFINAFWNGIVSVFVMALFSRDMGRPQGAEWWGLFFFLIPFEVIGLVMLVGLVGVLVEPLRVTSWRFTRQTIEHRVKRLGIGPTRTYWVDPLRRIELDTLGGAGRGTKRRLRTGASGRCRLVFIDQNNTELVSIDGLTRGEARWMGDAILRERSTWFR